MFGSSAVAKAAPCLPRFDPIEPCPKCGARQWSHRHRAVGVTVDQGEYQAAKPRGLAGAVVGLFGVAKEHIASDCGRCAFRIYSAPLDAGVTSRG